MSKTILHFEIDPDELTTTVERALELNDNAELFSRLAEVQRIRDQFNAVEDVLTHIEASARTAINDKAKALYGPQWSAIRGEGYKITRSQTGSIYEITGEPPKELIEVKQTVKSKLVDEYVKAKSKLPTGIGWNPNRGESIRIRVDGDE